jgi:hypothetical protein
MITVTAEIHLPSSLPDTWAALGRRASYLCFPGVSAPAAGDPRPTRGALCHELDLPLIGPRRQAASLSVARSPRHPHHQRRFTVRGELVSIAGRWRLEPLDEGVRACLTLDYDVCPPLREQAVNELRSRSPLPIRTDADAILGRAVDDFFETRFTAQAAAYCECLRARLDRRRSA